jgi:small-conductance mechanosensitive channel
MKSEMRIIMYQEFKNYDIRIPWPIRTIYQGDEKREAMEIGKFDKERNQVIKEHGPKETEGMAEED